MEREYIRDRTLEGQESARKRGKTIGGAGVTDDAMLSMALHLRDQEMSLRDIAARPVITTGAEKGQHHPSGSGRPGRHRSSTSTCWGTNGRTPASSGSPTPSRSSWRYSRARPACSH
ncbi:hypothetical protein [Streptomyces sp. NPDC090021]|uniref:hypothetical protein n=1 Tax=Streptomyces sp. NPDC090021 TaxID=3365919 RepID=UPI00381E675A